MPVCRHCNAFYQAASNHDAVCPAARVQIPDALPTEADPPPPLFEDMSLPAKLWEVFKASIRGRRKMLNKKRRLPRICKKWNSEILEKFQEETERYDLDELDSERVFKWNQLVWQEVLMWNSLDEMVTEEDFLFICDLRGLSDCQRKYLEEMLEFMKLKGWTNTEKTNDSKTT